MAYAVSLRTREMGVRLALGASPGGLVRLVLGQGLRLAAVGVALGIALAFAANRLIAGMLAGVSAGDPLTLGAVALTIILVAAIASALPALRAGSVRAADSLRSD